MKIKSFFSSLFLCAAMSLIALPASAAPLSENGERLISALEQVYNMPEFRTAILQDGMFSDFSCVRQNDAVVLTFTFNSNVNFGKMTSDEIRHMQELLMSNFTKELGDDLGTIKGMGVKIRFILKDAYGHSVSQDA